MKSEKVFVAGWVPKWFGEWFRKQLAMFATNVYWPVKRDTSGTFSQTFVNHNGDPLTNFVSISDGTWPGQCTPDQGARMGPAGLTGSQPRGPGLRAKRLAIAFFVPDTDAVTILS